MNRAALAISPEPPHLQLVRFVLVGTANTSFSYGLYALGLLVGLPYYLASLLALCAGVLVGFVTHGRLVFRSRLQGRFGRFVAAWGLLYLINLACISALAGIGVDYYIAGLVTIVPVTACSFVLQRRFVFGARDEARLDAATPLATALALTLGICALMRAHMVFGFEINWDEFLNLSMVYDWRRGELHGILQTAFVHLFGWLPVISINEVDQVIAGRALVALFAIVTSFVLYRIARRFVSLEAALLAVLAYNAFSFVFRHGISFRTDPLATACMMTAIWLAVAERIDRGRAFALGVLAGIAGAMTIKAVFFLLPLVSILLVRFLFDRDRSSLIRSALLAAGSALATFTVLLWVHAASLVRPESPFDFLARTSNSTLARSDHSVFLEYAGRGFIENWWFWLLLATGIAVAVGRLSDRATRRDALILLALALPLLTPLIYSETYPYFYPLAIAPAAVLAGVGFERQIPLGRGLYAGAALAVVAIGLAFNYGESIRRGPDAQRLTVELVHTLFPSPVRYIDSTSMISSFPKEGLFMSRWGMRDYREAGRPVMADLLRKAQPRFLLDSRGSLDLDRLDPADSQRQSFGLLAEDVAVLKASFLQYWGPIHVPGFRIVPGRSTMTVRLAGDYALNAPEPIIVDGRLLQPGATTRLSAGTHVFAATTPSDLRLDLPPPPRREPPRRLFWGF